MKLPSKAGEEITIEACGLTLRVKKLRRDFFAKVEGQHQGRFGNASQIREDIEAFRSTGALPRGSSGGF